jgi:hypothetical protein
VLAPFPLGSADFVWICIWNVLLAFSLLTANLEAISRQDFRLLMPLFLMIFLIIAIVMLQTWPNPPIGQTDSVWKLPHELLGTGVPARISMTATGPSGAHSATLCSCRLRSFAPFFLQPMRELLNDFSGYLRGRVAFALRCAHEPNRVIEEFDNTLAPLQFVKFCMNYLAECVAEGGPQALPPSERAMDMLREVNAAG